MTRILGETTGVKDGSTTASNICHPTTLRNKKKKEKKDEGERERERKKRGAGKGEKKEEGR